MKSGEFQSVLPKPASKDQLEDKCAALNACIFHANRARLRRLINQAPVMAFIKGTPEAPRCGFTKQLLAILQEDHVPFGFYDILGDPEVLRANAHARHCTSRQVREGLKELSKWPTYPQLYVKGELIGGLDIVKARCHKLFAQYSFDRLLVLMCSSPQELRASGEFQSTVKSQ